MRILHLASTPVWSGPMDNIVQLALEQRRQGHEVSIAVDRLRERLPYEEPCAERLRTLQLLDEGELELSVKSSPVGVLADWRRLRQRRLDVVHAHRTHDHLLALTAVRSPALCFRSFHTVRSIRGRWLRARGYTIPTESARRAWMHPRVMVLPPLVDETFRPPLDRSATRHALNLAGSPLIGMISSLQASRRHILALRSFARLLQNAPAARLVIVGDGPEEQVLRTLARTLRIENAVSWVGYQTGESFVRHLQCFDQVWILGLGHDESARAAAQARACGAAVVAAQESALPAVATAIVALEESAIVEAALHAAPSVFVRPSVRDVAAQILTLYTSP